MFEVFTSEKLKFYIVRTWAADWLAMKASTGKPATLARYTAHVGGTYQPAVLRQ